MNRCIVRWLREFHEKASDRKHEKNMYKKALEAVERYPAPLSSGADCLALEGFGEYLRKRIDRKIATELRGQSELIHDCPVAREFVRQEKSALASQREQDRQNTLSDLLEDTFCRSVLLLLCKAENTLSLAQVQENTVLPEGIVLDAVLQRLLRDGLVAKARGRYTATEKTKKMLGEERAPGTEHGPLAMEHWAAAECEICLVYDTREFHERWTRRVKTEQMLYFQQRLKNEGIVFLEQQLLLGDFLWVVRRKGEKTKENIAVLDFIVERKRGDDFIGSLRDGRLAEQKSRLRLCGCEKVVYLLECVEEKEDDTVARLVSATAAKFALRNKLNAIKTESLEETLDVLVGITRELETILLRDTVGVLHASGGSFSRKEFLDTKHIEKPDGIMFGLFCRAAGKGKPDTVGEVFLQQLLSVPRMTSEKAAAVLAKYPTMPCLWNGYRKTPMAKRPGLLKEIETKNGTKIGHALSVKIHRIFFK
ncbi:MAG: crossover junction endonuclease Mus81 [Amphiamblys sp. WSBS2006]|nr:MAG: crossover junction endonuclease Mus81 [Amphiamblys sp. WSBS2006]